MPDMIASDAGSAGESKLRDWYHAGPGVVLLRIPAGEFSRIEPGVKGAQQQTVELANDFWASDREISVEQYRQFLKDSAELVGWTDPKSSPEFQFPKGDPKWPMQNVSWFEALAFCNWLSEQEGLKPAYILTDRDERPAEVYFHVEKNVEAGGFRLPTEAEWEYFTRAGTRTPYSCGDHQSPLADYANYGAVSPAVCGSKMCNGWGLFDTHGNVMEWCQDKWGRYPDSDRLVNPQGAPFSTACCFRGGGWFNGRRDCRSEYRSSGPPISKRYTIGFRVVRNAR
jgi:formylglycine-generating enzyme required for sulfatase activity